MKSTTEGRLLLHKKQLEGETSQKVRYIFYEVRCSVFLFVLALAATANAVEVHLLRTPDGGIQPQAAVEASGIVHLIYFKGDPKGGDIFYVRREPGREQFSQPLLVNRQPHTAMAIGTIRGAQLAVGRNGRVHVAWNGMGSGNSDFVAAAKGQTPLLYTRLNEADNAFEPERNIVTYAYGLDGGSSVAADLQGNVYVTWHAPRPGNTNGEAGRAVFVARSTNEGKSFLPETEATSDPTGACACCGMRAFADNSGAVYLLFRAAGEKINRDETLLISNDFGIHFRTAYAHGWKVTTCPMSSASLSEGSEGILAAAETHGRVFFVRVDPATGRVSSPVSPEVQAKHPVAIANRKGETLFVWTEGTGWNKGGAVGWQLFDRDNQPITNKRRKDGVQTWSLATAFAEADGNFTIVY